MGAMISDLKFRLLFHKFVPINFLDAKNGPEGNETQFFVFLHLHRKVIIIYVFFLLKGGPP